MCCWSDQKNNCLTQKTHMNVVKTTNLPNEFSVFLCSVYGETP